MEIQKNIFNGSDYVAARDNKRLTNQYWNIYNVMKDGTFRTLSEITQATGEPPASISAQLRHMRKTRFGSHIVNKKYLGDGLYTYQLVVNGAL